MGEVSTFDSDAFMSDAKVTGELSTEYKVVPEGEYKAVVVNEGNMKFNVKQYEPKEAGKDPFTRFELFWKIDAPGNPEADGKVVRQQVALDLDKNGAIDTAEGKNVRLGRLQRAVGQLGMPDWDFFKLEGQVAVIKVKHSKYESGGEEKTGADVADVSALAA